jgi:hypothetical protein
MANYIPDDLQAENADLERRRRYAELLMQQSNEMPQGGMVGKVYVKPSWTQQLASAIKGPMAAYDLKETESKQKKLADMIGQRKQAAIDAFPKEQGTVEGSTPMGQFNMPNVQMQTPQMTDYLKWGVETSKVDPNLAQLGMTMADKMDNREQRMQELQMRLQDARLTAQERMAMQKQLAEMNIQGRQETARLVGSMRQLPAPIQITDAAGNVKLVNQQGELIKDLGGIGKPSASFEKSAVAKKKSVNDLNTAINELEEATKDGGLIDQSTGSGAGAAVDSVARFVGQATPGAIAAGKMAPIYDLALKMVPRFEGPQSDKDTQSYKEASGLLANPAIPNAQKKAAGKEILRLMKLRRGQFAGVDDAEIGSSGSIDSLLEKYK